MPRIEYEDKDAENFYNQSNVNKRISGEHGDVDKSRVKKVMSDDYQGMRDGLIKEGIKRSGKTGDPIVDNPPSSWLRRSIYGR